jgi:hypothetical protein
MKRSMRDLKKDERGAIMLSGVVMAAFLIAAMWFVVGVGDAIFFKVRAQEASDHVAYSSAVVHARGMNFISALNAIMYAITAVHIVMGILHDLFKILAPIADLCAANPFTAAVCVPIATFLHIAIQVLSVVRPIYAKTAVAVGLPAAATAQTIAAKSYPAYAVLASAEIGRDYKKTAFSVSASLREEVGIRRPDGKRQRGHEQSLKLGLPVVSQKMKTLCEIFAGDASSVTASMPQSAKNGQKDLGSEQDRAKKELPKLQRERQDIASELARAKGARREELQKELAKKDEEIKKSIELSKKENARNVGGNLTSAISSRYCPEPTWDDPNGPKALFEGTRNGGAILQTWGFVTGPGYVDRSGKVVAVGTRRQQNVGDPKTPIYYAQAELYFDCDKGWKDDACNGDEKLYDKSLYAMNWRARLRRFDPNVFRATASSLVTGDVLGAVDRQGAIYSEQTIETLLLRPRGRTTPKGGLVLH